MANFYTGKKNKNRLNSDMIPSSKTLKYIKTYLGVFYVRKK